MTTSSRIRSTSNSTSSIQSFESEELSSCPSGDCDYAQLEDVNSVSSANSVTENAVAFPSKSTTTADSRKGTAKSQSLSSKSNLKHANKRVRDREGSCPAAMLSPLKISSEKERGGAASETQLESENADPQQNVLKQNPNISGREKETGGSANLSSLQKPTATSRSKSLLSEPEGVVRSSKIARVSSINATTGSK